MQLQDPRHEDMFNITNPTGRIVLSLFSAFAAGLVLGIAMYRFPEIGWRILMLGLPGASALLVTGYSFAKHATITHLTAWFWWVTSTIALADVITRTLHHKIDDPFIDLVTGTSYVLFCTLYLWKTRRKARSSGTLAQ